MVWIRFLILISFFFNCLGPVPKAEAADFLLPKPGVIVHLSPPVNPPMLKGIKVHADNPFRFEFVLDQGDSTSPEAKRESNLAKGDYLKEESTKLIKYFLASLTIPEKDLWVNLSPYEKDRIIPESFGLTEMGRDLLAEDYMLKQITASLIYPEDEVGKKFWKRIYEEAQKKYHTTNIPMNTFNKVWIVPEKAVVYENAKAGTAYVVESKLKVMLEEDYLSMEKHVNGGVAEGGASPVARNEVRTNGETRGQDPDMNKLGSQIVREIIIPELSIEINEGKNFSQLRQVYNSLILATWYKKKIKDSILSQVYSDKNKTAGVNISDPKEKDKIYGQYLQAFKKGVYNYIKEEADPVSGESIPRKYFSGGFGFAGRMNNTINFSDNPGRLPDKAMQLTAIVMVDNAQLSTADQAMKTEKGRPVLASRAPTDNEKPIAESNGVFTYNFSLKDLIPENGDPKAVYLLHLEGNGNPKDHIIGAYFLTDVGDKEGQFAVSTQNGVLVLTPMVIAKIKEDKPLILKNRVEISGLSLRYDRAQLSTADRAMSNTTRRNFLGVTATVAIAGVGGWAATRALLKKFSNYVDDPQGGTIRELNNLFIKESLEILQSSSPLISITDRYNVYLELRMYIKGNPDRELLDLIEASIAKGFDFDAPYEKQAVWLWLNQLTAELKAKLAPELTIAAVSKASYKMVGAVINRVFDHPTFSVSKRIKILKAVTSYGDFLQWLAGDEENRLRYASNLKDLIRSTPRDDANNESLRLRYYALLFLQRWHEKHFVPSEFIEAALNGFYDNYSDRIKLESKNDLTSVINAVGQSLKEQEIKVAEGDQAMKGGIDFNADKMNLETRNQGEEIKFKMDATMLEQLRNAPGFTPVIINIQPLTDIKGFLGINEDVKEAVTV